MKPNLGAIGAALSDRAQQQGAEAKNLGPEAGQPGLNLASATCHLLHNPEQITYLL